MDLRVLIALYRAIFGALAFVAIGVQLSDLAGKGTFDPVNYFSYFTIDSNVIGGAVLLVGAAWWRRASSATMDLLRGAAVVYLSVTGVVFSLLLSGADVDTAIPWVNAVVHEVMPIVIVIDWLLDPPRTRLTNRQGLLWLSFPAAWIIYTLIRGALVGRYPYPFLDPANGGYASVAGTCVAILIGMTLFCLIVVAVGNALAGRTRRSTPARA